MKKIFLLGLIFTSFAFTQTAIKGEKIFTMSGDVIFDGVVLIKDGKIEKVGKAGDVEIPNNYKIFSGKVVTPGLIDAHSTVGMTGIFNYSQDQNQLEKSDPIQPELRAFDAYNPVDELVDWVRDFGVTTLHTGHGPGAVASGQTMIVKTFGSTIDEVLIDSATMVAFTIGYSVSSNFTKPGTKAKSIAMLRSEFLKAKDYLAKQKEKDESKRPARDLKLETLAKVLNKELKALFTVQKANDILSAIRLRNEFGFDLILDGCADAYLVIDEIKKANVPVILHPTMMRTGGETQNLSWETAKVLKENNILFAIQSGYEGYVPKVRVVLFEAALAAANGLSFEDALASITIDAAKIIGREKSIGSIAAGKDADIVIFDGDPFEYTTHACEVFINGILVKSDCK